VSRIFTKRPPEEPARQGMNPQDYLDSILTEAERAVELGRYRLGCSLLAHALTKAVGDGELDQVGVARRARRISVAAGRGK
jgi:hypothetical protein